MGRPIKRKIIVDQKEYFWVLDSNSIDGGHDKHIRVHRNRDTKSILYIDPYPWHLEIRPKAIESAIKFARTEGWKPSTMTQPMYISMNNGILYVLPQGILFGNQDKNNSMSNGENEL